MRRDKSPFRQAIRRTGRLESRRRIAASPSWRARIRRHRTKSRRTIGPPERRVVACARRPEPEPSRTDHILRPRKFAAKSVALRILGLAGFGQTGRMHWQNIRLELGGTCEFPKGSAGRTFLLRLPLHEDGSIDEAEVAQRPSRATVRRFWASEPDSSGRIVRCARGWECRCEQQGKVRAFCLPSQPLRLGEPVIMTCPDGCQLPFRVASMTKLG